MNPFIKTYSLKLFILVLLFSLKIPLRGNNYQINSLSVSDGLSHNEVTSIAQDKYGFMWFATRGGLNRYDGYTFKHFKPGKSLNSINSPSIERVYSQQNGVLWIGSKSNGVSSYASSENSFTSYDFPPFTFSNRIISFYEDAHANMWIGSWDNGVLFHHSSLDSTAHYLKGMRVSSVVETVDGTIWCGTNRGLFYKKPNEHFTFYDALDKPSINDILVDRLDGSLWIAAWNRGLVNINDSGITEIPLLDNMNTVSRSAYCLEQDQKGSVWVGTWGSGGYLYDVDKHVLSQLDYFIEASADKQIVLDMYHDKTGMIWAATEAGVVRFSTSNSFRSLPTDKNLNVTAIYVDEKGVKWLGNRSEGLMRYTNDALEYIPFINPNLYKNNNANKIVRYLSQDGNGLLWVGLGCGLFVYDQENKSEGLIRGSAYFNSPELMVVLKVLDIEFMGNKLWISTQQQGVFLFEKRGREYRLIQQYTASDKPFSIGDNRVTFIEQDKYGQLWFGTYSGVYLFQEKGERFIPLKDIVSAEELPICDISLCSAVDDKGDIWFGTPCGLAHLCFSSSNTICIENYTVEDDLADDYITGIAFDDGYVWLSTSTGISRMAIKTKLVRNFNTSDGIQSSSFFEGSFFKDNEGLIHFGGHENLVFFDPKEIQENTYQPSLVFTEVSVMNQPLSTTEHWQDPIDINDLKEIVLTHKEKAISIEFASLDFKAPQRNLYAYKLDGYDNEWQTLANRRLITFNNLERGKYILHIKGSNSNGVWSENVKSLKIRVLPAPWRTVYALIIYIIIIMGLVYSIIRVTNYQLKLENEAEVDRLKREQEQLSHESRMVFFTNISHEIRTPLTLMMAPIKELISKDYKDLNKAFFQNRMGLLNRSVNRLYDLVNQLLEIRKVEVGKSGLKASETDLSELLKDVVMTYKDFAKSKHISFQVRFKGNNWKCYVDKEKLRVVFYNLLSNAFKYAGTPGEVVLKVNEYEDHYVIKVVNNGAGLTSLEMEHLFERFYQASNQSGMGSSGIGLSLVKSFVELHKGTIDVSSIKGVETIFKISLRKGSSHLSPHEIVIKNESNTSTPVVDISKETPEVDASVSIIKDKTVLVVDDNSDVRDYLRSLLSGAYNVSLAGDGMDAIKIVSHYSIDLIISDVMMPRMDGFEFCERIKSNDKTSDVPVILLTAKSTMDDQKEGVSRAADAYIVKPFDPDFLLSRVKQLLTNRAHLIDKYSQKMTLEPTQVEITSEEAIFIEKAIAHVESQISNSSFTHSDLASHMAMSASTFYRRIKKSADMTPADFVKSIRLKRAAQYLRETPFSISEIMEKVGYLDLKNFRKIFKKEFGSSPSEYRRVK